MSVPSPNRSPAAYRPRSISFLGHEDVGDWRIKRYAIAAARPTPGDDVIDACREITTAALPDEPDVYPAAFTIAHEGAKGCFFLLFWWVGENMLQHRMWLAASDAPAAARLSPELGPCVWDQAVVWHERNAWVRHVLADGAADLDAYIADGFAGEV
jgi:hypothetical protein